MTAELKTIECEPPCQGVAELLADLTEKAARGEFSAISVALVYRDGCTSHGYSVTPSRATMIGAIEQLKHALLMRDYT